MASARLRNTRGFAWFALLARMYPLNDTGIPVIVFRMGAITALVGAEAIAAPYIAEVDTVSAMKQTPMASHMPVPQYKR